MMILYAAGKLKREDSETNVILEQKHEEPQKFTNGL